ncbi:MAG: UvrD-helicase domain-containing protein [Gemmatimonadota bacterium]|nr:UvrD-helicase domain-containing protein [Gemmatimonadota bacterium]
MSGNGRRPPDQSERDRISEDLDRNLLVEAGAGSGKTRSLVDRMVALVGTGTCTVDRIAAVTFTRKAAAELRQRFQVSLEQVLARMPAGDPRRERLEYAIRDLDRAFLGTIHAFCAKLLRERPLEAGLDPGFREVQETEGVRMKRAFWLDFLERLGSDGDPDLEELERLGIEPDRLQPLFDELVENPDVDFGFQPVPPPDEAEFRAVRARFNELLDRAGRMMRNRKPRGGWDPFGRRMRTLLYWRRALDWDDRTAFFDALARVHLKKGRLTQYKWADTPSGKAGAKALGVAFQEFAAAGSRADALLRSWWAHRYPVAMRVANRAARAFAQQRKDRAEINFQDLLVLTAALLRDEPGARRDLGRRYRHVLVDEFQDTDPLQAEILLLLTSEPEAGADWTTVVPRPGALFVVGDPKQSIYRFRRADIALYDFVKNRFRDFGDVLLLAANFRSLDAIEALVKGVFDSDDRFAGDDTDRQAAFAPLLVQPWVREESEPGPGLLSAYTVAGGTQGQAAEDDAGRIATEIARRVAAGERGPGDFMVLTRTRKFLGVYARALEDRNLPVEVSGAGVGFEDELGALLLLFRCLADPAHEVRVLGVLSGPLFGITLDRLVEYRDGGGCFRVNRPADGDGEVADALNVLHGWWKRARREPADLTAERLVAGTGLFPLAAAGTLGQLRAGALVYLLNAVRGRALEGDTSIAGAVDALETALEWEDAEAPLVPERPNCVRVMNLHRAKGLEAPVVFLAAPFPGPGFPPKKRVARDGEGVARGTMPIVVERGWSKEVIAQPPGWEEEQRTEAAFEEAEKVRLLYVAATRARDELWVARWVGGRGGKASVWEPVESWVVAEAVRGEGGIARVADLPREDPPAPDVLDPGTDLAGPMAAVAEAAIRTREPTYRLDSVTRRAKTDAAAGEDSTTGAVPSLHTEAFAPPGLRPATGGFEWGSVVHEVLAAAGEGTTGDALIKLARDLLVEYERPVDSAGAPTELEALIAMVESVRGSEIWNRAMAAGERHAEIPFAVNAGPGPGRGDVIEGVIDLVFREAEKWVVADYKTDTGDDPDFMERVVRYRAQVDVYAQCWERLTGEEVAERVILFTSQGRTESW